MEYNLFSFRHKKKLLLPLNLSNFYFYSFFTSYPALNCYLHRAQPQHSRLQQHFLNDVIRIFDFDREIDRAVLLSNRARKAKGIRYLFEKCIFRSLDLLFDGDTIDISFANSFSDHVTFSKIQKLENQKTSPHHILAIS